MDLKATIANGYRNRLIAIAVGALLYASWALYDANIGYPKKIEQFDKYLATQAKYEEDWQKQWAKLVDEFGYDEVPEEKAEKDIPTQWVLFGITFPIGAYCLLSLGLWSRRYVGADNDKLYATGGVEVGFDKITRIDASRWETKGIARVFYDAGQGENAVVIDNWKYERAPSDAIYDLLVEQVDEEKFEGLSTLDTAPAEADA